MQVLSKGTATPRGYFNLLYFASASSYTRKTSEYLPAPLPITNLFEQLELKYPGIQQTVLRSCAVTVNLDYVDVDEDSNSKGEMARAENGPILIIREGDEVAIIPPVSSG